MLATVVLCDMKDSRKIADRRGFAESVRGCLQQLNQQRDTLIASFKVQAGIDEFAGIVKTPGTGHMMRKLWFDLYPHAARCSVVTGALDIQGVADASGQAPAVYDFDGPAFHQAADQLASMQQTEQLFCYHHAGLDVCQANLISGLGDLLYAQMLGWTQRQHEIVSDYLQRGSQSATAKHLGISQSAISHSLSAIDYARFSRTLDYWQACFQQLETSS